METNRAIAEVVAAVTENSASLRVLPVISEGCSVYRCRAPTMPRWPPMRTTQSRRAYYWTGNWLRSPQFSAEATAAGSRLLRIFSGEVVQALYFEATTTHEFTVLVMW